jgi:hypothetical protein
MARFLLTLPSPRKTGRRPALAALLSAALLVLLEGPALADGLAPQLRLSVEPSRVSVEGRGVRVAEVLSALGAAAGFSVTGVGSEAPVDHLSIQGPSMADVLRQLLRDEDHAVVYREDTPSAPRAIDTIVLFGSRAPSVPPTGSAADGGVAPARDGGLVDAPARSGVPGPEPAGQASGMASEADSALGALLRAHARPGSLPEPVRSQPPARGAAAGAGNGPGPAAPSDGRGEMAAPGADQDLAAATRKAQENLRTLIQSLGAASRSLLQPAPPSR